MVWSAWRRPRPSRMLRCSPRRRSCKRLAWATSWVRACLNVYSCSGKSRASETSPAASSRASLSRNPSSVVPLISPSRATGTSLPITDAAWSTLLQEEGVALGALDQEALQRCKAGVLSHQALEQRFCTLRHERSDTKLADAGLAPPAGIVLGPIVH